MAHMTHTDEGRLRAALDGLDLFGVILDTDGCVVFANAYLLAQAGRTDEAALGLNWFDAFVPDDVRETIRSIFLASITTGDIPARYENEILVKDGARRLVAWSNSVLRDATGTVEGVASLGMDITERRAAAAQRLATQARLDTVLRQLPGMLWSIDTEMRCTASLGAGLAALDLTPNQIVGVHLFDFAGTSDPADPAIAAHRSALAGTPASYDATFAGRRYACHVEPLRGPDGAVEGAIGVSFDLSEREAAEAALRETQASTTMAMDTAIESLGIYRSVLDDDGRFVDAEILFMNAVGRRRWLQDSPLEEVRGTRLFAGWPALRPLIFDLYAPVAETGVAYRGRPMFPTPQGDRTFDLSITPFEGGFVHVGRDVTDEQAAVAALERSEERLRRTLEGVDAIIGYQEHADAPVVVSPQIEQILGWQPSAVTDLGGWRALVHPDDLPACVAAWRSEHDRWAIEYRMRRADGTWAHVSDRGRRIPGSGGHGPGVFGVTVDVTAQHEADEARREAADRLARLGAALEQTSESVVVTDLAANVEYVNPAFERVTGYAFDEVVGRNPRILQSGAQPPAFYEAMWATLIAGETWRGELINRRKDRTLFVEESSITPVHDENGKVSAYVAVKRDVTEQRQAQQALAEAEERYRSTVDTLLEPLVILRPVRDASGRIVDFVYEYANDAACAANRMPRRELLGRRMLEVLPEHGPAGLIDTYARVIATGQSLMLDGFAYTDTWGGVPQTRVSDLRVHRLGDSLVYTWRDVTERQRAQDELVSAAGRNRLLVEESADGIFRIERRTGRILEANAAGVALFGLPADEVIGQRAPTLLGSTHAGPITWPGDLDSGEAIALERTLRRRDGGSVIIAVRARLLGDGSVLASARDITGERELTARLLQAQRLESIGRLAGGIAHDFNNMLAAVQGYGELARASLPEGSPAREDIDQILFAADRAAVLTRQLLAFSRRQVLEPEILDPAAIIDSLVPMVQHLLGIDVELRTEHQPGVWPVRVDPGQLEQVVVNLAVNARDAMPGGGSLVIRTTNVETPDAAGEPSGAASGPVGPCVRITVTDTGIGMDAATQARMFEPFFSTKGEGNGSGMGLATVFGIVEQSGGRIACDSAPDRGTTFTIDLPRARGSKVPAPKVTPSAQVAAGSETVLLVEDETVVRAFLARILDRGGYRIRVAASANDALAMVPTPDALPDLLVTDVQMPGMPGPELARRLRAMRPDLPVLFISGYAEDLIDRPDGEAIRVLEKPFNADSFAAAVRAALDERSGAG